MSTQVVEMLQHTIKNIHYRILKQGSVNLSASCNQEDQSSTSPTSTTRDNVDQECGNDDKDHPTGTSQGSSSSAIFTSTNADRGMKQSWGGQVYSEDCFPDYHEKEHKDWLKQRYKAIPEEFYTRSGLEVVTPDNFEEWLTQHKDLQAAWAFQEQWSGSGRLSLTALRSGLTVLFPVDYRYGWDLMNDKHREYISKVQTILSPS
mgnify:CR=1 FL=1